MNRRSGRKSEKTNPNVWTGISEHLLPRRHGLIQSFPKQLGADLAKEDAEAKKLQDFVITRLNDRRLNLDIRTQERLLPLPPAKAEILYRASDAEARRFALNIWFQLGDGEGLWKVGDEPIPLTEEHFTDGGEAFAVEGVKIFAKQVEFPAVPSTTLDDAISQARRQGLSEDEAKRLAILVVGTGATEVSKDPTLPDNFFKIIVCTRAPAEGSPLR